MSFINPLFLIATSAALLPVLYHFVRRARVQTVPFSSIMLLKDTQEELVRKRRLQDILLMIVRMLLFALLAMAFARPFLPSGAVPASVGAQNQSIVVLIDNSLSMQYGDVFGEARQEALRHVQEATEGDELSVLAFSDDVRQLTDWSADHALHRSAIETQLRPSSRPTNLYRALQRAAEVVNGGRYDARRIVLISDFQANGWRGQAVDSLSMQAGVSVEPVNVAPTDPENAYVQAFDLNLERRAQMYALEYTARVASPNAASLRSRTARLSVGNDEIGQRTLSDQSPETVAFQQSTDEDGVRQGVLSIDDDALPADDQFYFTYVLQNRPSLLALGDAPNRRTSGTFFLQRAFDMGAAARYQFTADEVPRLTPARLQRHDAIFLTDASALSETQTQALRGFVEDGGGLVLSLEGITDPEAASAPLQALEIGDATEIVHPPSEAAGVGDVDARHPVFSVFDALGSQALWQPSFRQYVQVQPRAGSRVIATYDTGDPLLIERELGQGRVLVYTSSFHTLWTDLPATEAFIPFVYQLAAHASRTAGTQPIYQVGEAVPLRGEAGRTWDVRTPSGDILKVTIGDGDVGFFRSTEAPGHYVAEGEGRQLMFSVNPAPRESELTYVDPEEVLSSLTYIQDAAPAATPDNEDTGPTQAEAQQKLWRYLIYAVLALFALETLLANRRLGSRSRRPARSLSAPPVRGKSSRTRYA